MLVVSIKNTFIHAEEIDNDNEDAWEVQSCPRDVVSCRVSGKRELESHRFQPVPNEVDGPGPNAIVAWVAIMGLELRF